MRQLGEFRQFLPQFKNTANVHFLTIFREDKEEAQGLAKIRQKALGGNDAEDKAHFTIVSDLGGEGSKAYDPLATYVINPEGIITLVVPGTVRTRASAEEVLKALK